MKCGSASQISSSKKYKCRVEITNLSKKNMSATGSLTLSDSKFCWKAQYKRNFRKRKRLERSWHAFCISRVKGASTWIASVPMQLDANSHAKRTLNTVFLLDDRSSS